MHMYTQSATNPKPTGHLLIAVRSDVEGQVSDEPLLSVASGGLYWTLKALIHLWTRGGVVGEGCREPRPLGVRDYLFRHAFWDIVCGHGILFRSQQLRPPSLRLPGAISGLNRFLAAGALGERVRTGRALRRGLAKQGMPA